MTYKQQQNDLLNSFLERQYFNHWKLENNREDSKSISLELIVTSACNTACTYCYYKNFREELNPASLCKKDTILSNLDTVLLYLKNKSIFPSEIEIFSGEFFKVPYYKIFLEKLYEAIPDNRKVTVVIPTNCTFCLSEESLAEVDEVVSYYNNSYKAGQGKMRLALSLSTDGILCDNISRPLRDGSSYSEEYYEKLMQFAAKHHLHFHPMLDSSNISLWKDNFKWFVESIASSANISKKLALRRIYLLEVRNPDWTLENLKDLKAFIEFLYDYLYDIYDHDLEQLAHDILSYGLLNLSSNVIYTLSRGLGCSIQSALCVKLSDLSIVNCHRTSYKGFETGKFIEKIDGNEKIVTIEAVNPNLGILIDSFDFRKAPKCATCNISQLCSLSCIGCNFEVNRDFFLVPETVCNLERTKVLSIVSSFEKLGLLDYIIQNHESQGKILLNSEYTSTSKYNKDRCTQIQQLSFLKNYLNNCSGLEMQKSL